MKNPTQIPQHGNAEAKTVGQIPDRTGHGSREHRSHPGITGNATITGAMEAGESASRDTEVITLFH